MPREKRKFSPDFKAQVAIEACMGLDTVHTIAAKYEVHPVQVSTWNKELQENLATVFATKRDHDPVDHAQKEARLYQKIAQLEVELDWLKKNLNSSTKCRKKMVDPNYIKISTRRQCQLLGLPRSSYYHEPKGENRANSELMA